jgi:hypothetical protein
MPGSVAVVDDVVEDIRGVGTVRETADLVDHEHVRMGIGEQGFVEASLPAPLSPGSRSAP